MSLKFPDKYTPQPLHGNVFDDTDIKLSFGQRVADKVASNLGSWPFLIAQSFFILAWIVWNVVNLFIHFDKYPFILLNLMFSVQAAYSAPLILMSQKRQSEKDSIILHNDYISDKKAEGLLVALLDHVYAMEDGLQEMDSKIQKLTDESK